MIIKYQLLIHFRIIVCGSVAEHKILVLTAPAGYLFDMVMFASFGTPDGSCNSYSASSDCDFPNSVAIVGRYCLGKSSCTLNATNTFFGSDPCRSTVKTLSVQLHFVTTAQCK